MIRSKLLQTVGKGDTDMKNLLTLTFAVAALAAFTDPSIGQEAQQKDGQKSHGTTTVAESDQKKSAHAPRGVSTGMATGQVIRVNRKVHAFTITADGEEVTFSAKKLTVLPVLGKIIDITYTRNAGGPMEATSIKESNTKPSQSFTCLPADVKDTEIAATLTSWKGGSPVVTRVTVGQKLMDLKARCSKNGTLIDATGKEIIFHRLTNCYGTPPPDLEKRVKKEQDEINAAIKKGTVIEITCNPSGVPIP
jgi:hypothetical protein